MSPDDQRPRLPRSPTPFHRTDSAIAVSTKTAKRPVRQQQPERPEPHWFLSLSCQFRSTAPVASVLPRTPTLAEQKPRRPSDGPVPPARAARRLLDRFVERQQEHSSP